jgi:CRISPR system Cascade subunit CasB
MPDTVRIPASADALVRRVTHLVRKNPGDRSTLRHSLGKLPEDAALGVHRIVVPFLPVPPDDGRKTSEYEAAERACYAVAALIASQPRGAREQARTSSTPAEVPAGQDAAPSEVRGPGAQDRRRRNLGYSLAHAVEQGGNARSMENHLQLLARQDVEGLYRHLPRLILQLRGDQVRIDWGVLIRDLTRWARDPRLVAKEWAQSYYRTSERLAAAKAREANGTRGNDDEETAS